MIDTIQYTTEARYFTYGNIEKAKHLVFALHGYGQLPAFFIRKFHHLNADDFFIVAPEGPHRFYLQGTGGRVGASWMTKENREQDIENYIAYLTEIYKKVDRQHFISRKLLGFSQGGATASRWHGSGLTNFSHFILWAAVFPPDMPFNYERQFEKSKNHYVIGDNDQYADLEKATNNHQELLNLGLIFDYSTFKGDHNIDKELAFKLLNE